MNTAAVKCDVDLRESLDVGVGVVHGVFDGLTKIQAGRCEVLEEGG